MEREEIILTNRNGFIWIETLVSLHVILVIMTTVIPIYTTVQKDKQILHDRSVYSLELFNELQIILHGEDKLVEKVFKKRLAGREVTFEFSTEGDYRKGCATWKNAKGKMEKRCLYGIAP